MNELSNSKEQAGKAFERLIAFIEGELLPEGFCVVVNERSWTSGGRPAGEFDIVVRGRVGSTNIAWLIECRDRKEKAGVDWIQQLPTRRSDNGFDKVTAVSTSGFTEAAIESAQRHNIELRTVVDAPPHDLLNWIRICSVASTSRTTAAHGPIKR